jgi:hypothetical protein
MALKTVDKRDDVPEPLRESAVETKDGRFVYEEASDPALGDKGEKALEAMKQRARDAEKARQTAEAELERLRLDADARANNISEEKLREIREKADKTYEPIKQRAAELETENRKLKLTDRVRALWLKHRGHPEREEDAMAALDKRTDLGDQGGIVYKDKDGTITADNAEAFFAKFKAEKPWFFLGSGSSGSNARGSDGTEGDEPPPRTTDAIREQKRREIAGSL